MAADNGVDDVSVKGVFALSSDDLPLGLSHRRRRNGLKPEKSRLIKKP
jgi:hypothetical protein